MGQEASVFSVAFSPTGEALASASYDSTVKLWEVATASADDTVKLWRAASDDEVHQMRQRWQETTRAKETARSGG